MTQQGNEIINWKIPQTQALLVYEQRPGSLQNSALTTVPLEYHTEQQQQNSKISHKPQYSWLLYNRSNSSDKIHLQLNLQFSIPYLIIIILFHEIRCIFIVAIGISCLLELPRRQNINYYHNINNFYTCSAYDIYF